MATRQHSQAPGLRGRVALVTLVLASATATATATSCGDRRGDDHTPAANTASSGDLVADTGGGQPLDVTAFDGAPGTEDTPAGSGGDPAAGAARYAALCASCHGDEQQGGAGPALQLWPRGRASLRAVITHSMPPGAPASCDATCAADIEAWLLERSTARCALPPRRLRLLTRREWARSVDALLPEPAEPAGCLEDLDCAPLAPASTAGPGLQSCAAGVCAPLPCGSARFVLPDPGGPSWVGVVVAGAFNGWQAKPSAAASMIWDPDSQRWWRDVVVGEGAQAYKFVVTPLGGGEAQWLTDPGNSATADDGFGGANSVLTISCDNLPTDPQAIDLAEIAGAFPVESRPEGFPFDNHHAALVTPVLVEQHLAAGKLVAAARAPATLDTYCAGVPAGAAGDLSCAEALADALLPRAFRRTPTAAERKRYVDHFASSPGADREARAVVGLRVLLSSPLFLYRSEVGVTDPGGTTATLTGDEIATTLAFLLWGRGPDAALREAAASGALAEPEQIAAQAERLLADDRARPVIRAFALQWLGVERVLTADKHPGVYPGFTDLRTRMADETATFVERAVLDVDPADWRALLLADHTWADAALAAHYGDLGAPDGSGNKAGAGGTLQRRPLQSGRRSGLLGHGSVLASYAHSDQTSPIRRGLFVRQRLLCHDFPPPPPDAGGVPDIDPNATTRERFAQHSADPACTSCHQHIDTLGFGFERFDAAGGWREQEHGVPIDPSGEMNDVEALGAGTTAPFSSLPTLAATLASSDAAASCFAAQWLRFARGDREGPADHCALQTLRERFGQSGGDVRALLIGLTQLEGFTRRRMAP